MLSMRILAFLVITTFCNFSHSSISCSQILRNSSTEVRSTLSVVVPVFKELHNGNLRRLLSEISQLDVLSLPKGTNIQLVLVVNNTKSVNPETRSENRLTVNILNQKTSTHHQSELASLEKIKRNGISVTVVDRVSPGFSIRRIGFVRNLGVETALKLASKTSKENHFIANLDADTSIPQNYLTQIAKRFSEDNSVTAMFLNRRFKIEPGSTSQIYKSTHFLRFRDGKDRLFEALGLRTPEDGIVVGGPQIVVRASDLKKVGGIPRVDTGEDWILANTLWNRGGVYRDPNLIVRPGDRARPEGYDAKLRLNTIDQYTNGKRTASLELENYLVDAMDGMTRTRLLDVNAIKPLFVFFNIPFNSKKWIKAVESVDFSKPMQSWIRIDEILFKKYLPSLKGQGFALGEGEVLSTKLLAWFKANISSKELKSLEESINTSRALDEAETATIQKDLKFLISGKPIKERNQNRSKEFFEENSWILKEITELRKSGKSDKEIYEAIVNNYPEWFLPYLKSIYRGEEATLFEITKWIYEVKKNSSQFTTANTFFQKVEELITVD